MMARQLRINYPGAFYHYWQAQTFKFQDMTPMFSTPMFSCFHDGLLKAAKEAGVKIREVKI
jgi:hypothetical protein